MVRRSSLFIIASLLLILVTASIVFIYCNPQVSRVMHINEYPEFRNVMNEIKEGIISQVRLVDVANNVDHTLLINDASDSLLLIRSMIGHTPPESDLFMFPGALSLADDAEWEFSSGKVPRVTVQYYETGFLTLDRKWGWRLAPKEIERFESLRDRIRSHADPNLKGQK